MKQMRRLAVCHRGRWCSPLTSGRGAAPSAKDAQTFLAVVLHNVVDERAKLDADSTTTSDLVDVLRVPSSRMAGTRSR